MTDSPSDDERKQTPSELTLAAASFLVQALGLGDDPATIAGEFVIIKEDSNASIHSVQMDSSVGPAAFLVYVYDLQEVDQKGASGGDLYETGRMTLDQAADRDTPGPRMVAHADTDTLGFILATTPATWRALRGESAAGLDVTAGNLQQTAASAESRSSAAEELHRTLREANSNALAWLTAVQAEAQNSGDDALEFSEEELALALHVMDDANIRPLLTSLNLLIATAQEQAGNMTPNT
ncbi:MAG: hypothetical protein M3412_01745 [Chloroflexota bacterium]|nr:hypothetical protein [Chloroflexota bacterium]